MSFFRPSVGPVTDVWGPRPPLPPHHGWDFGFYEQNPDYRVFAVEAGTVTKASRSVGMGFYIEVDHGGYSTRYNHLRDAGLVSVGDHVSRGQRIGTMGSTGTESFGTHLHFEVWVNGVRVDPAPYFSGTAGGDVTPIVIEEPEEEDDNMKWYLRDDGNQHIGGVYTFRDYGDANRASIVGRLQCDQTEPVKISTQEYNILKEEWSQRVLEARGLFPSSSTVADPAAIATALAPLLKVGASVTDVDNAANRVIAAVPTAVQNGQASRAAMILDK